MWHPRRNGLDGRGTGRAGGAGVTQDRSGACAVARRDGTLGGIRGSGAAGGSPTRWQASAGLLLQQVAIRSASWSGRREPDRLKTRDSPGAPNVSRSYLRLGQRHRYWRMNQYGGSGSVDEDGLADAFRTGSAEGVRAVYERYSGAVFTIALRVLGDRDLAADAVQVTFLNAWRSCGSLEPGRPLAPWLFTIARRAAIDLYRRRAHAPEPTELQDEATIALPPSMEGIWEAWQIRIALDMLPAEEREVVRAQHFGGLSHAQIARQLAVPIGTVKSRSHRAHRRLASMLGHLAEVAA